VRRHVREPAWGFGDEPPEDPPFNRSIVTVVVTGLADPETHRRAKAIPTRRTIRRRVLT